MLTSRFDAYISKYGDFCAHDDNDNNDDNDKTDYFTPCACARGNNNNIGLFCSIYRSQVSLRGCNIKRVKFNMCIHCICDLDVQWNPSKADTIGTKNFVRCSEVSLAQGIVIDHVSPIIAATYDKALLWAMKKTVLMRDLSTDSS